ncbi:hypothetical protein [Serratia phage SMP]|uniref:Uncharacterized protein n=1 Tax=Serratia phage SMP TaxID=2982904 RepID=A0A9E8G0U1_9CAUD|nr:hypothetical protein [Serratia phage SMP]
MSFLLTASASTSAINCRLVTGLQHNLNTGT